MTNEPTDTIWRIDPHTTIKHLVYQHYINCWMGKILQRFPEAGIVDGFAGPGEYVGGVDGSPMIIARRYLDHQQRPNFGNLRLIAQESRTDRVAHLRGRVASLPHDPQMKISVPDPASFTNTWQQLSRLARPKASAPVLWILDPFSWTPVPFDQVIRCLTSGSRDEVLVTLFIDEVYRFLKAETHAAAITNYFGTTTWRNIPAGTEHDTKQALIDLYCAQLQTIDSVYTGKFSVTVKNQTPRYTIIYATHHRAGLECWRPVTWRLDEDAGQIHTFKPDLFTADETDHAEHLAQLITDHYAGSDISWHVLAEMILHENYLEKHLRLALNLLRSQGLAVRVAPLEGTTPWPETSTIRIFRTDESAVEGVSE